MKVPTGDAETVVTVMELAIDTSTRYASIALARGGEALGELTWRSEQNHTVELLPAIQALLTRAQASVQDLGLVVVAKGPGNFSALRVGLSLAKGLAEGLGIPMVGIPTLLVEAFPYLGLGVPVYPLLDAGRGDVAWASFVERGGKVSQVVEERVTDLEALCAHISPLGLLCGEGASQRAQELRDRLGEGVRVVNLPPPTRRAGVLVRLGARRLTGARPDDLASLQPIYMRGPSITAPRRFPEARPE